MSRLPLQAIQVFECVARLSSFTKAATELNMTQSAISYQIGKLEKHLGGSLFTRRARGVELTSRGKAIAPIVSRCLQELAASFRQSREETDRVLTISTMQTIASNWLAPRIGTFQVNHPEYAVRIDISSDLATFTGDGIDVALRAGSGNWPGLIAHKLFDQEFVAVASPAYLAKAGMPEDAASLLRHRLIAPSDDWWSLWAEAAGLSRHLCIELPGVDVETQQMAGSLATAGHGIALVTPRFEKSCLSSGQLVPLLGITGRTGKAYYLVHAAANRSSPKIMAFRDWVLAAVHDEGSS